MRTRFLRGNTAENNALTLAAGELSVDTDKKAVRLHDGQTPGGFEMVGSQAVVPGESLIAGDTTAGYYGPIDSGFFIPYADLVTEVGLSYGTLNTNDAGWLKFAHNNKTLYVAKNIVKYAISYNMANSAGLINGSTTVVIGGKTYIVRLLTGALTDPAPNTASGTPGREWADLIIPTIDGTWDSIPYNTFTASSNSGKVTFCVESIEGYPTICVYYTTTSTGYLNYGGLLKSQDSQATAWRPVLELVE